MSSCVPPEMLRRWLDGELPANRSAAVSQHVVDCLGCQATLDDATEHAELRSLLESAAAAGVRVHDTDLDGLLARLRVAEPDLEAGRIASETRADPSSGPTAGPVEAAGLLGTFHLLDELGRGGMGIVHRAWDPTLRREVAIKILRPELAEPAHRLRLVREAQLAAQFRHDHVVLIFSVVDPPEGLPYLVMEYVAGHSLAERLVTPSRPDIRQVATWIAQIAGALEAAHVAGLIHRDVKPGNILIDESSGRAKVADFGLARVVVDANVTQLGWTAGTPSYMSPEQAAGEPRLDARTDLYSLGATLYEGLTGVPPYLGEPHLVLRQIIEDDPRPLRQLDDRVPRDLETICLKAMERDPSRRYQTAAAMADDLGRWLRGEPIRARPVGRPERVFRWCRRNPWVAGLATSLLAVILTGFVGITWQWRRAERNARHAGILRRQAEANLEESRAAFLQARHAVDGFYARFYERGVFNIPGLEGVRHEILTEILQYYKSFIAQHGADPALRRDVAEACIRLGRLTFEYGSKADALAMLRRGLQEFDRLSLDAPLVSEDLGVVANCINTIGQLENMLGQDDSARRTFERGITLAEASIREHPSDLGHRRRLAALHGNLAGLFMRRNERKLCLREYRAAEELQQDLVRRQPASPEFLNDLAMSYNNMSMAVDEKSEALRLARKGLELRQEVVRRSPTSTYFLRNLARSHQSVGVYQSKMGKHDEALEHLQESRRLMEQIVGEQPAVQSYQSDLAQALGHLGDDLVALGRRDPAREVRERARTIYRKVLHSNPDDIIVKVALADLEASLAALDEGSQLPRPRAAGDDLPREAAGADPAARRP